MEEDRGAKKPRLDPGTSQLTSEDVQVFRTSECVNGFSVRLGYISQVKRHSLQDVKDRIQRDDELYIHQPFYLYPAFKEALLRLVTKVEEVYNDRDNPVRVIMVHGVPNVGKSSLAACLGYYLALAVGEVQVMKLIHTKDMDTEDLTQKITDTLCARNLIVDQVNTGCLQKQGILRCIEDKFSHNRGSIPLIMFTSGHYAPRQIWLDGQNSGWMCYKVINMRIDDAFLSKLRQIRGIPVDGVLSNSGLLNVTNILSRMIRCLDHIKDKNPLATDIDLQNVIYPKTNMDIIRKPSAVSLLWLAFQEFLVKGLPKPEDFTDEHCKMEPCCLEYLGYMTSHMKDQDDRGIGAIQACCLQYLGVMTSRMNDQDNRGVDAIQARCLEYFGFMTSGMNDQGDRGMDAIQGDRGINAIQGDREIDSIQDDRGIDAIQGDGGIDAILKSMDITGSPIWENNNYTEYNPSGYFYKFLIKNHLYEILERVVEDHNNLTLQQKCDVILKAFKRLQNSEYDYLAGRLFEIFIKCLCDREGERRGCSVGMECLKRSVSFTGVSVVEYVPTVTDFCNLPFEKEKCKREETSFWCILNVPGKPTFKGYDFAYMVTTPDEDGPVLRQLELFQVTVNPLGKSFEERLLMTDVLAEVRTALERKKLIKHSDAEKIVVPYFVVPHLPYFVHPRETSNTLDLPCRNSSKMISVEILVFPKAYFSVTLTHE